MNFNNCQTRAKIACLSVFSFLSSVLQVLETTGRGMNQVRWPDHMIYCCFTSWKSNRHWHLVSTLLLSWRAGQLWQQHHFCPGTRRRRNGSGSQWLLQANWHHQGIKLGSFCPLWSSRLQLLLFEQYRDHETHEQYSATGSKVHKQDEWNS